MLLMPYVVCGPMGRNDSKVANNHNSGFPILFSVKNILFFYSAEALICECLNLFSHTAMKVSRHVSTS